MEFGDIGFKSAEPCNVESALIRARLTASNLIEAKPLHETLASFRCSQGIDIFKIGRIAYPAYQWNKVARQARESFDWEG